MPSNFQQCVCVQHVSVKEKQSYFSNLLTPILQPFIWKPKKLQLFNVYYSYF